MQNKKDSRISLVLLELSVYDVKLWGKRGPEKVSNFKQDFEVFIYLEKKEKCMLSLNCPCTCFKFKKSAYNFFTFWQALRLRYITCKGGIVSRKVFSFSTHLDFSNTKSPSLPQLFELTGKNGRQLFVHFFKDRAKMKIRFKISLPLSNCLKFSRLKYNFK